MEELKTLAEIKKRTGMTYDEIAAAIGVTSYTVRNWLLYGRRPMPFLRKRIRAFIKKHNETTPTEHQER